MQRAESTHRLLRRHSSGAAQPKLNHFGRTKQPNRRAAEPEAAAHDEPRILEPMHPAAILSRQRIVANNRHSAGQTNLSAVSMPAQKKVGRQRSQWPNVIWNMRQNNAQPAGNLGWDRAGEGAGHGMSPWPGHGDDFDPLHNHALSF